MRNEFGDWLKQIREAKTLTQSELARRSKLNRAVINKIESGQSIPVVETLIALSVGLDLPKEQVLRAAGLLDPVAETEQVNEEILYLLSDVTQQDREEILELLRIKADRNRKSQKSSSRGKPPARTAIGHIEQ
jgi:transcriptional regulator with XRE-family HTH domain